MEKISNFLKSTSVELPDVNQRVLGSAINKTRLYALRSGSGIVAGAGGISLSEFVGLRLRG